jgi:hypothetical protein
MRTCIRPVFSKAAGSEILQRYSGIAVRTILPALTMTLSISASKACDVVIYNTRECDPGHCAYNPHERDNPPQVFYGRSQFGQYRAVEFTCGFNRARSAFGNSFSIGCGVTVGSESTRDERGSQDVTFPRRHLFLWNLDSCCLPAPKIFSQGWR